MCGFSTMEARRPSERLRVHRDAAGMLRQKTSSLFLALTEERSALPPTLISDLHPYPH